MPVEGLPDRARHRLCWSCRRWFLPHEGVLDFPPNRGPVSYLLSSVKRAIDEEGQRRFYCDACHAAASAGAQRSRNTGRLSLWLSIAIIVAIITAWRLGFFDHLIALGP